MALLTAKRPLKRDSAPPNSAPLRATPGGCHGALGLRAQFHVVQVAFLIASVLALILLRQRLAQERKLRRKSANQLPLIAQVTGQSGESVRRWRVRLTWPKRALNHEQMALKRSWRHARALYRLKLFKLKRK